MYPHRLFLPQVLISGGYALRRVRLFHRYNFRFLLLCIPGLLNPGLYPVFRLHPVFHLYLVFHLHPVSLSRLPRHLLFLVISSFSFSSCFLILQISFILVPQKPKGITFSFETASQKELWIIWVVRLRFHVCPVFQSHFYMISGHCHKTTGKYRKQCNKKDHIQQTSAFPAITMKAIRLYSRFHLSHPLHPPNIHKQKKAGSSGSILSPPL